MRRVQIPSGHNRYGSLVAGFFVDLPQDYCVLAGKNNAGKSTILQKLFATIHETSQAPRASYCYIGQDRQYILPSAPPPNNLQDYNNDLYTVCANQPRTSENVRGPNPNTLYTLLLHRSNLLAQVNELNKYLVRIGFDPIVIRNVQRVNISDVEIHMHGSGVRCLLPILCALTSEDIKTIIIDEPEISLEARSQKVLKEILVEGVAKGKEIYVATQSHLFLNREKVENNFIVSNTSNQTNIAPIRNNSDLLGLTYNLLGNSLSDLFFPNNFLIVEGASDQKITEKVASLIGVNNEQVKIISARGIDNVGDSYKAIKNTLIPLIAASSPYSQKVVVLVDKPNASAGPKAEEVKNQLQDRYFELNTESIEEYIPAPLYTKAGRDKNADLSQIDEIKIAIRHGGDAGNIEKLTKLKADISSKIASVMTASDVETLPLIVSAIRKASEN